MPFDAVVFPGQGAQRAAMGVDFIDTFESAKAMLDMANGVLPFDYLEVVQDSERLNRTDYTQPCIVLCEAMMHQVVKESHQVNAEVFAGHSLGEYAALIAAEVLPLDVALVLVTERGRLMHETQVDGAMAAVVMDNLPLAELQDKAQGFDIDIANDNSMNQVVLSGEKAALHRLCETLEGDYGQAIRVVVLNVSAPFHSRYMKDVEEAFYETLKDHKTSFAKAGLGKVVSNYLGGYYSDDVDALLSALAKQLSGQVRWRDNMQAIVSKTHNILELGPNRPLRGFFLTLGVNITSIMNVRSLEKAFQG